jgi:hypothetical protein
MGNTSRRAVIFILLRFHPLIGAATPKAETKEIWEAYLQEARGPRVRHSAERYLRSFR